MVRSAVSQFRVQGRMAQGVKLVRLSDGATLVSVSVCAADGEDGAEPPGGEAPGNSGLNTTTNENEGENT